MKNKGRSIALSYSMLDATSLVEQLKRQSVTLTKEEEEFVSRMEEDLERVSVLAVRGFLTPAEKQRACSRIYKHMMSRLVRSGALVKGKFRRLP